MIHSSAGKLYGRYDKRVRQSMSALTRTLRDLGRGEDARQVEREMLSREIRARLPWTRKS